MARLRDRLHRAAASTVPVLIQGESGTGKDLLARLIHAQSPVAGGRFVRVSCPAIPGNLMESELFGYEKGAFTGATTNKPGRIELAHHGTLFLDEIAELDPPLQAKLLHLLQDGCFSPIGGEQELQVDARILATTNRTIADVVASGALRQDLLYRIGVVTLTVPPLRERVEDLPALVAYFLDCYRATLQSHSSSLGAESRPERMLSASTMSAMRNYAWPGNIRELENLIQRYLILGDESVILSGLSSGAPAYPLQDLPLDGSVPLKVVTQRAIKEIERRVILAVLHQHRWNRKKAAATLDISYRALLYKIRELGVPARSRRTPVPLPLKLRAAHVTQP